MSYVSKNLTDILLKIETAYQSSPSVGQKLCRLVAVSKEKPIQSIIEAYVAGQRHFAENKIVHLFEKSHSSEVIKCCPDIKWHFIGRIQTNKIKKLAGVNNLYMVETVDSIDHAQALDSAWGSIHLTPLNVMIQVNTSDEPQKGGIKPSDVVDLHKQIEARCLNLRVVGLMCIGREAVDIAAGPNPDFLKLVQCRQILASSLRKSPMDFELSMGMSDDFEHAIHLGSTNVRIGTSIFGPRESHYVTQRHVTDDEKTST
uniref:Pyridoxal phosphate homeostasis protein n=2 Tax=Trichobilharzia regenti TaxID=157069 RepID=A0AA85KEM8_TRIRE|nr:unnamed protein product [Trichobilharzia regenti]